MIHRVLMWDSHTCTTYLYLDKHSCNCMLDLLPCIQALTSISKEICETRQFHQMGSSWVNAFVGAFVHSVCLEIYMDASILLRVSIVANHMGLNILISPQSYCMTINSNKLWKRRLIINRIDKTVR